MTRMLWVVLLCMACQDTRAPGNEQALSSGNKAAGEQLYVAMCASCHGERGEGTPAGSALYMVPEMSNGELWDVIIYGTDGMPAYPQLSDIDVADLIAWMDELAGKL